jgi:hypothetical protein
MHTDRKMPPIPTGLVDALRSFPAHREVEHCGARFRVSSLDLYADCPECGTPLKLRAFSAGEELEDVIDAVLEWMLDPEAKKAAMQRQAAIACDLNE